MRLFLMSYIYFVLLLLPAYAMEDNQEAEESQGVSLKILNDNELLNCFKEKNYQQAPNIKHLHITYEVPSILLYGLFSESEDCIQPQIEKLESLSLNRRNKDYKPSNFPLPFTKGGLSLKSVANLKYLTSLDLSHVLLEKASYGGLVSPDVSPLASLPKLKTLILKDTNLIVFKDFSKFSSLTELNLSHNKFFDGGSNHDNFKNLSTLVSLDISYSNMEIFCQDNPFLCNLQKLNIKYNYNLDATDLTSLINLKELNMSETKNCNSDKLKYLSSLQKLEVLDISKTTIFGRNIIDLLKMNNLNTIYISKDNFDKSYDSQISSLLSTTDKKLIFCNNDNSSEDDGRTFDVEGLITTEDFIRYNDNWSRGKRW